jgi:hypothetical protein
VVGDDVVVEWHWLSSGLDDASWIVERLQRRGRVGGIVPAGFDAYARILHPIERQGERGQGRRWRDVAVENGRVPHPEMQFHLIATPAGTVPADVLHAPAGSTSWGSLPPEERNVLVTVLERRTATPDDCWFAVWDGWGSLDDPQTTARLRTPGRHYLVARGPVGLARASVESWGDQSPTVWWPEDRAWIVVTEIDFAWTYVGGSNGLIDELLDHDQVEAVPASLDHDPTYDGDQLNVVLNDHAPTT